MTIEFTMPKLGHLLEEGTVVGWRKQVGDRVTNGEILLEIETDKTTVEVESLLDGILLEILVEPGEKVPVGTPLALFSDVDKAN